MRADMAKVIVERSRVPSYRGRKAKGHPRRFRGADVDRLPAREGMKECWEHTKHFSEHLNPLLRYLDRQVGRPWDKVFSEICAHIPRNSAVKDHVRDRVEEYVVRHVLLIDGVPCDGRGGRTYGRPLAEVPYRGRLWYVCPRTGLLRRVTRKPQQPRPPAGEKPPRFIRVGDGMQCRPIDGAWHLVTLAPLPPVWQREQCTAVDAVLHLPVRSLTPLEARRHFGAEVCAVSCRPLARKELSQYPIPERWWSP